MSIFAKVKKAYIVKKLRTKAQKLKGTRAEDIKIDKEFLDCMQVGLVKMKNLMNTVNYDSIINQIELHCVKKASTAEGAKQIIEDTKRSRKKIKELIPVVETLLGEASGICENKDGIQSLIAECKRAAGSIIDQAATLYSDSNASSKDIKDLVEQHVNKLTAQEEENGEEDPFLR